MSDRPVQPHVVAIEINVDPAEAYADEVYDEGDRPEFPVTAEDIAVDAWEQVQAWVLEGYSPVVLVQQHGEGDVVEIDIEEVLRKRYSAGQPTLDWEG